MKTHSQPPKAHTSLSSIPLPSPPYLVVVFCVSITAGVVVVHAELEEFELELDANIALDSEEDGDEGDNHNNNSDSTEEASPVSPAVATSSPVVSSPQQLQDTAASIKRARSGSASVSAHGFHTPSPIHTPRYRCRHPTSSPFAFGIDAPHASPSSRRP
ncbi:hypothetical protein B0H14DRAFT_1426632 [Mycena olivaceomarginata]|nr:hypothetical protein B0H14DRAFT_1426632 [Mycena olivaceomarginata]